ncbi:MAG: CDC48 family AAA ATPase [archaeon]|nr:CDC48 family AAA ATPase [archaeon]
MTLQTDTKKEIVLKVQDPDPSHVGRNIVTLDRQSKNLLEVTSGDIVEIQGAKKTAAIIWPARQEDETLGIIRMDNLIRHNAGISLGEKVVVRKAEFKEAKKVILAPTQEVRIIASGYDRILKKSFIGRPLNKGDNVWISVFGSGFIYTVVDTNPRGVVKITDFTQFVLKEEPVKEALEGVPKIAYEDIGGLDEQVKKVREMIELPMKHPELFRKLGINPPKGVLLHGPPGTGKTLLAKAVANETQAHFISINAPEVMSKFVGEAEERIRQMFKEAEENAPSIIFIDEIDAIAPKREEVVGEVERRVVAQLLALMDGMEARGNVIVIAATNRVNSLDEALRRPGRFDREIEIGVPDKKGRKDIMQIHTRGMPLTKDVELDYIANITHGFVGADLEALAKEAAMKALRRYLPKINLEEEEIPPEVLEDLEVNKRDFSDALREVQPSALREVMVEIPNIKWNDIGGLDEAKKELQMAVEWPLKNPQAFKKMGIRPPRGILLYGPPGTGKTLLAKAVATESEANFISIKGPELISKWVGDSEKGVKKIFRKARQVSPCIVFFDEIDSIAPSRGGSSDSGVTERVVNQLLTELDGVEDIKDVVFIAATNRPDLIDAALLRPGRIDKMVLISGPDKETRKSIFEIHTTNTNIPKEVDFKKLLELINSRKNIELDKFIDDVSSYFDGEFEELIKEAAEIAKTDKKKYGNEINLANLRKAHENLSKKVPLAKDVDLDELAEKTEGYSGADIEGLVREATLIAMEESNMAQTKVTRDHFEKAMHKILPSITKEVIENYGQFREDVRETYTSFKPKYVD